MRGMTTCFLVNLILIPDIRYHLKLHIELERYHVSQCEGTREYYPEKQNAGFASLLSICTCHASGNLSNLPPLNLS
jgi:hypothetical protein